MKKSKNKELMKFQDCVATMNKDRKEYYKKYYKKHKKEIYAKVKKWRERQKYNKISLKNAEKYGNLLYKVVKDELAIQLFNGIEASIEQAQYCLEQKKIDLVSDFLKQAKEEVNKLWEMIKKGMFDKCIN